jgi:hypothetical protein
MICHSPNYSQQTVNGPVETIHASIHRILRPALAERILAFMIHRQEECRECIFDLMRGSKCVGSFLIFGTFAPIAKAANRSVIERYTITVGVPRLNPGGAFSIMERLGRFLCELFF